jgi:hypothetical protein
MGPERQILLLKLNFEHSFSFAVPLVYEGISICVHICPQRDGSFSAKINRHNLSRMMPSMKFLLCRSFEDKVLVYI